MKSDQNFTPEYLTAAEAAEHLRCSPQYLGVMRHRGDGPRFCRLGRVVRYRITDLEEWMRRNEVGGAK
jgi:hypothetical protein